MSFFSESDPRHMAVARALAEGLGYGPYESLNHNARPAVQDLTERVITAVAPLSCLSTGHAVLAVCPGCGEGGLSTRAMTALVYEFVVCECDRLPYPHLVEQMWHREHMGRPGEAIAADTRRETYQRLVRELEANARSYRPRRSASDTAAGGLRRAARLVRQMLGDTPDREGAGRS